MFPGNCTTGFSAAEDTVALRIVVVNPTEIYSILEDEKVYDLKQLVPEQEDSSVFIHILSCGNTKIWAVTMVEGKFFEAETLNSNMVYMCLEHAARGLGATRWIQFSRITLPLLGPSIASGAALTFARSLGEFGATITFAGSMQGTTRTLPLEVYLQREQDPGAAIALSLVLIFIAVVLTGLTTFLEARNMRRFDSVSVPNNDDGMGALRSSATAHRFEDAAPFSLSARVPERQVAYELEGRAGETLAIIGPNGSGKSTGIRLLAGDISALIRASSFGTPLHRGPNATLSRTDMITGTKGNIEFLVHLKKDVQSIENKAEQIEGVLEQASDRLNNA